MAAHMLVEYHRGAHGTLHQLLPLLEHDDPEVQAAAIRVLAEVGRAQRLLQARAQQALPLLIEAARTSPSSDRRKQTLEAIGAFGPYAAPAVPALIRFLGDDAFVAVSAAEALSRIGAAAEQAVPALIAALEAESVYLRRAAADALSSIGPAAMAPLRGPLASDRLLVHARAAESLGRMRPMPVDVLSEWLDDPNPRIREGAARALSNSTPPVPIAAPPLLRALSDEHIAVRRAALASLSRIPGAPGEAASHMVPLFADEDQQIRFNAVRAAARVGPDGLDVLVTALADTDPRIRAGAAASLASLQRSPRNPLGPAVEHLLPLLSDPDADARYWAAEALAAASAQDALAAAAQDEHATVRLGAIYALGRAGSIRHPRHRPILVRALRDPDSAVQCEAVHALAGALDDFHLRPEVAQELEQALADVPDDADASVRYYAARALARRQFDRADELRALMLQLGTVHDITPYHGFAQDLARLEERFEWSEGIFATPEAVAAAHCFATRAPLVGMPRRQVLDLLGNPGERLGWSEPPGHDPALPDRPLMYRFDTGHGGVAFTLRFLEGVVVDVDVIPMH